MALKQRLYLHGVVSVLLGALALAGSWMYRDFDHDDAYITYRYARHLAQGQGLVYNIGERVLGTSTPLYTALLAFGSVISGQSVIWISHLLCGLSLWLGSLALYALGKSQSPFMALTAAGLYASHPLVIIAISMETLWLNLLVMTALMLYEHRRFGWAGLGLGLLFLTRYETALLAAVLGLHFVYQNRRWPLWLTPTLFLAGVWLLFASLTYGQVLPQSAVAKLIASRVPFWLGALAWWHLYTQQTIWFNLTWGLTLLGGYSLLRRFITHQAILYSLLLAWSGLYGLAASLWAGSFPWYYGPLIPGLAILMAYGADMVRQMTLALAGKTPRLKQSASGVAHSLAGLLVVTLMGVHVVLWRGQFAEFDNGIVDARVEIYREVADWLNQRARPDATLATAEIGALGYYTSLRIIDLLGLITPELTPWLAEGEAEAISQALRLFQPDYVLISDLPEFRSRLTADYQLIQRFGRAGEYLLYTRTGP